MRRARARLPSGPLVNKFTRFAATFENKAMSSPAMHDQEAYTVCGSTH